MARCCRCEEQTLTGTCPPLSSLSTLLLCPSSSSSRVCLCVSLCVCVVQGGVCAGRGPTTPPPSSEAADRDAHALFTESRSAIHGIKVKNAELYCVKDGTTL
eukprot:99661-Rhodomonas_salina.1